MLQEKLEQPLQFNQSKNKIPDKKCIKLRTYYLKKLSLTQIKEEYDLQMN